MGKKLSDGTNSHEYQCFQKKMFTFIVKLNTSYHLSFPSHLVLLSVMGNDLGHSTDAFANCCILIYLDWNKIFPILQTTFSNIYVNDNMYILTEISSLFPMVQLTLNQAFTDLHTIQTKQNKFTKPLRILVPNNAPYGNDKLSH